MTSLLPSLQAIDSLLNPFWRSGYAPAENGAAAEPTLRPRVDIYERDKEYVIEAELPGVSKDDVNVEMEGDTLILTAARKARDEKVEPIHGERYAMCKFHRSFTLGKNVDRDNIKGQLKDGVLSLVVPKSEKSLPRRITVE